MTVSKHIPVLAGGLACKGPVASRAGLAGGLTLQASLLPRAGGMKTSIRSGALFAALLAAFPLFSPDGARAQAAACTPTQTVSATADADGVYTTTLVCADTNAAAGAADYRQLHYNHGVALGSHGQTNPADRDTTLANNNANNHLSLTVGSGVVFTADGYGDLRSTSPDGAIVLTQGGAKTVVVQDGAVINLERTPTFWAATDPDRPASATSEYDPAWYPAWTHALDNLNAITAHSYTHEGDADVTIELDGIINIDIGIGGTYGKPTSTNPYHTSGGRAIDVQVKDDVDDGARADVDVLIEVGATGAIRHVEGTDGLAGIYAENFSEDGDITVNLAEGSVVDVSEGGGYGVLAYLSADSNNNEGQRMGDVTVNVAGTIRAATRNRSISFQQGIGIFANQGAHNGRVRITSSGTIETVQGAAIEARAWRGTNTHHDDPATSGIEGHLVDVAGGTIETRGTTAIYASTGSVNADMTVRVAEGATVRAQALTDEDYANGAITQRDLGPNGNRYVIDTPYRYYGWRQVRKVDETTSGRRVRTEATVLEPIITAIVVRDFSSDPAAEGVRDQVLVAGAVETAGGKADVDPAIWMEGGGLVVVGATGRVSAQSGLAIEGGCVSEYRSSSTVATTPCDSKPARDLDVTVAGTVEGDIRLRGDGDLTATVMGTVEGDIHTMGSGDLAATVTGTVEGDIRTMGESITLTLEEILNQGGRPIRATAPGALTLSVPEGGVVTGTAYDPAGPLTVAGSIGRLLYAGGATVTVARTGALTGVEVDGGMEALRSEAGDLSMTVAGMVTGDVLGLGDGDHTVTVARGGTVTGAIRLAASTVRVDGTVAGYVRLDRGGAVTVGAGGRVAAAEGAGIRSGAGALDVTVAGTVNGIDAGGDLNAVVTDTGRAGDVDAEGDLDLTIRAAAGERPDQAAARVERVTSRGDRKVTIIADGKALPVGLRGTSGVAPLGPFDVGIGHDGRLVPEYAPRSRVYEALPSVLLGMTGTSGFHDRMAAPRSPNGIWARTEASGVSRETERSTSTPGAGLSWAERRYGVETGVDVPLETGVVGLSAHHRRASAEVSGNDGRIDVAGEGLGASVAWRLADGVYVAGGVSATRYDVAMKSGRRGSLRSGVRGFGHAVGVEAGRRVDLGSGPLGALTATPRARLSYSRVDMDDFTDAVDARVSLDKGRATTGGAGVALEASEGGSRVFGSVDVEHGFSRETVVRVSEVALSSKAEATRVLVEAGGAVEWDGGRYALQGAARWATGARDYGGGMAFKMRF